MTTAEIAFEIACTLNIHDTGRGSKFALHVLHENICFNERNHPITGMNAKFAKAVHDMLDKGLITREYETGKVSGFRYFITDAGREVLHKTCDIKLREIN